MQIAEKIQESFFLRQESEKMLERAKRAVEMAIETDEQSAGEITPEDASQSSPTEM